MSAAVPRLELQVGGAVPLDTGVYIKRRTDDELFRALEQGEYCNVLCPRQMGKTSAIFRVRAKLREVGCRTALIDLAGRLGTRDVSADTWYRGLLSEVNRQCQLQCDVSKFWKACAEPTANQKLLAFFRDEILGRTRDRVVVLLDEIDNTLNLTYTDDFFLAIRSLYNDRASEPDLRRLAFCLVGVFTPNELVKQLRTTTYNIGRTFEFEDFDPERDDLSPLVYTLSADSGRGKELLRAVLRWTGGQPYLTASMCAKVGASKIDSPQGVDRLVEKVFVHVEKSHEDSDDAHFENIRRFLGQRATARLETIDLYRRILRGGAEPDRATAPILSLKLSGLVKTDRNAHLVVRNEIYRRRFNEEWAAMIRSLAKGELLEELVLALSDLKFVELDGLRRASARARLVYEPGTPGQPEVQSTKSWRFFAPLGPVETQELRWYLEKFVIWPSEHFRERARRVEESLVKWGELLYTGAFPVLHTANVMKAWARIDAGAGRRFSVYVDVEVEAGAPTEEAAAAREAGTLMLGLPWELLHDGDGFLFQGANPTRVRRRLPNTRDLEVQAVAPPIRILLVSPRPEDEACDYIDHRASALPLVEAMEQLGGLVQIRVLSPPTLPALSEELERAGRLDQPYHVIHFDGHGVYDRRVGLGGLCFEDPHDAEKLERRRHTVVFTTELAPVLQNHRIPVVFLDACQSAQAEKASKSVASQLLQFGVGSVVVMSYSVLLETARRFIESFYNALAQGHRVGDAVLEGQRKLRDDTFRGFVLGAGELRLEDWFVPVLFQEKEDPQLFHTVPGTQTREDLKASLRARLGELPVQPETGFIGRSRELLALQRLLRHDRYAVVRGQGGEGKTALAVEFARWMVRSQQMRRAVFVSVEINSNRAAVLDAIGRQLVPQFSAATFDNINKAIQTIERALAEQSTLLVVDKMESILLPPYLEAPDALSQDARQELDTILELCARLNAKGDTRLVFTTRERLPAPFGGARHRFDLEQLAREDAVKLVERVLNQGAEGAGAAAEAAREAIDQLVDTVHRHARTLSLLAPALRRLGVEGTRASLVELMAEMEQKFPGSREKSVFASVELSLRRMSPANRERVRVLGVFYGAVDLDVLRTMMGWETADVTSLATELIETGLATPDPFNHLTLNPALCPYLRGQMDAAERSALTVQWGSAMRQYTEYLYEQQNSQQVQLVATLTVLELPNLFALLEQVERAGDPEATIGLATSLFGLLQFLGKQRLLERVGKVRDSAARALGAAWNHASFEAQRIGIEDQLANSRLRDALEGAQQLLQRARAAGEKSYPDAEYDLAMACWLLARVFSTAGASEQALPLLAEAQERFETIEEDRPGRGAERMASVCLTERGNCLADLGRLDESAAAYGESIRRAEKIGNVRQVAVAQGQLGNVRLYQGRYEEALEAHKEAREQFTRLDEPRSVGVTWHQIGRVYAEAGQPDAAEDAYRQSLAIKVRLGNVSEQGNTILELGNLYNSIGRLEEAATFYRRALDKFVEVGDVAREGTVRNNLADTLRNVGRLDEAKQEVRKAIECNAQFGHASRPWTSWRILAQIETAALNPPAAAEAKEKAIECYLAYRRDGGENNNLDGHICLEVTQCLLADDSAGAASLLQNLSDHPEMPAWIRPLIDVLKHIVAGSRDPALADVPALDYRTAAEILLLLEKLETSH